MSHNRAFSDNQHGFALVTAIFIVTILALFGLLIARFTVTAQRSSAEGYLWAQALYSAESIIQLNILKHDGGGATGPAAPTVGQIPATIVFDTFSSPGAPATIRVRATHGTGVSREVEAGYRL